MSAGILLIGPSSTKTGESLLKFHREALEKRLDNLSVSSAPAGNRDAIDRAVSELHASQISVLLCVPVTLFPESPVEASLNPLVQDIRNTYPDLTVEVLDPVGSTETFHDMLAEQIQNHIPYGMYGEYEIIGGEKLRKGFTTGSCAAGAAKIAVQLLAGEIESKEEARETRDLVRISLPENQETLTLPVSEIAYPGGNPRVGIRKDAGDDPDITDGVLVRVQAEWTDGDEIELRAGDGVGTVTEPGLKVEPGEPAINPVPEQMIRNEVHRSLPEDENRGVRLTVSIPEGKERAEKTYNKRLGIEGGLSILGTTGKVTPMSLSAWKQSLLPKLDRADAEDVATAVLVTGNRSRKKMIKAGFDENQVAETSNFIGEMLERAASLSFDHILLVGHIGKVVKVSGGIFNTYSKLADARLEIITAEAALAGLDHPRIVELAECPSAERAGLLLQEWDRQDVLDRLIQNARERIKSHLDDSPPVDVSFLNLSGDILASSRRLDPEAYP